MVERQLAFSILQLVALSLPAFAILLQIVVSAEMPYTHYAVPLTTAGLGMFIIAGGITLGELLLTTESLATTVSISLLLLGMVCLLFGASIIGLQTGRQQRFVRDKDN